MQAPNYALLLAIGLSLIVTQAACSKDKKRAHNDPPPAPEPAAEAPPPAPVAFVDPLDAAEDLPAERADWWYEKTARTLTGHELKNLPDAATLRALPRRQFVETLAAQDAFADQMLKFNLSFLGFLDGPVKDGDGKLSRSAFNLPAALNSARALATGGDYLSLFDAHQAMPAEPWSGAFLPYDPDAPPLSQAEIRAKLKTKLDSGLKDLIAAAADPAMSAAQICDKFFPMDFTGFFADLDMYGVSPRLSQKIQSTWTGELEAFCVTKTGTRPDISEKMRGADVTLAAVLALADAYDEKTYRPTGVAGLKVYDLAALNLPAEDNFSANFFAKVTNSSTNFDRRRGAYVLKRFFCDDLTPINQAIPESHAEGRHASDPACVSCHYKLDPMAGFFKDRGVAGIDFGGSAKITFDDLADVDRDRYEEAWRAPDASGRAWDIGYIRSLDDPTRNSYGASLDDLFKLIRTAPEPKTCLVRRLFSYFNGEGQAIDPAWLDDVAGRFTAEAAQNSSDALRRTVTRIVLGKTFSEPDPVSTECYDRGPQAAAGGPPCQVSSLLAKHCASCHAAAGAGGLDLTRWVSLADGGSGFPHVKDGKAAPRGDTMQAIADRLASGDNDQRMPLGKFMPAADRETIYLWAQKEASK